MMMFQVWTITCIKINYLFNLFNLFKLIHSVEVVFCLLYTFRETFNFGVNTVSCITVFSRFSNSHHDVDVVLQIWWGTLMKPLRTRQTEEDEVRVHVDWTAVKGQTFSGILRSSFPNISDTTPTKPETFLLYSGPRMSESDWLVPLLKKQNIQMDKSHIV